jgi:hypothetical protein
MIAAPIDHYETDANSLSNRNASSLLAGERMGVGASRVMNNETLDNANTDAPAVAHADFFFARG